MASYTKNLNLLKKDPVADANDTFNIQTMLNDNWEKLDAAVGAAKAATEYSQTTPYATGDYCTHDGKLYKCTTAITAGEEWNAAHWKETSVDAELKAAASALTAHTGNRSNPHGVTPAQIGAAPESLNRLDHDLTNDYLWVKAQYSIEVSQESRCCLSATSSGTAGFNLQYSDNVEISATGQLVLKSPISSAYLAYTETATMALLSGKYWTCSYGNCNFCNRILKFADTPSFSASTNYINANIQSVSVGVDNLYKNSGDTNFSCEGYTFAGKIGAYMSHIEHGSYVGTGTCGSGNETIISAPADTKLLIVQAMDDSYGSTLPTVIIVSAGKGLAVSSPFVSSSSSNLNIYSITVKTIENGIMIKGFDADGQLNRSGTKYAWVSIS